MSWIYHSMLIIPIKTSDKIDIYNSAGGAYILLTIAIAYIERNEP